MFCFDCGKFARLSVLIDGFLFRRHAVNLCFHKQLITNTLNILFFEDSIVVNANLPHFRLIKFFIFLFILSNLYLNFRQNKAPNESLHPGH